MKYIPVLGLTVFMAGCTTNVSNFQMPGTDISQFVTLHIKAPVDDQRDTELNALLVFEFEKHGFKVVPSEESTVYGPSDAKLEYKADWHWDITPYLLDFRVAIYEPKNDTLIAQAHSFQSSLARKDTTEIVSRAVSALLSESTENGANYHGDFQ